LFYRRCRGCNAVPDDPGLVLCPICRAASEARKSENRRAREREQYYIRKAVKREKPARPPRPCATKGCPGTAEGRAVYCAKCRRQRQKKRQKHYREERYVDPLLFVPPTSMAWLDKFRDWSKSGASYAAYQAAERNKSIRKVTYER
jgi:hypothetical protein